MNGVVNGVYFCQNNRTTALSNRMYERNVPSEQLSMTYGPRPVPTRYVLMPMLDCRKPSKVSCLKEPIYSTTKEFSPGNTLPFDGYQNKIDVESKLKNIIFPMQKCGQSKYIPSSKSDLFNAQYLTRVNQPIHMTNQLLFHDPQFSAFNPNTCNTGGKFFNNYTRYQIRSLGTKNKTDGPATGPTSNGPTTTGPATNQMQNRPSVPTQSDMSRVLPVALVRNNPYPRHL